MTADRSRCWVRGGKRLIDVVLVLITIWLWGPLLVCLAVAARFSSGRPVFFVQERIGRDGKPFNMLKLRTMHAAIAPAAGGAFASWTYRGDPRVTPIGRWLRRWRLDEIPQLFNVLIGDMSLVGPRPETREVTEYLSAVLPDYCRRLTVLPGLTGLCQVSETYLHFATMDQIARKLELDLRYVERISAWTDAKILLSTLRVLVCGRGVT
jgi:lipopolysaccharide/colanic/teichoic acid biosynthesis glycosyltransferase